MSNLFDVLANSKEVTDTLENNTESEAQRIESTHCFNGAEEAAVISKTQEGGNKGTPKQNAGFVNKEEAQKVSEKGKESNKDIQGNTGLHPKCIVGRTQK